MAQTSQVMAQTPEVGISVRWFGFRCLSGLGYTVAALAL